MGEEGGKGSWWGRKGVWKLMGEKGGGEAGGGERGRGSWRGRKGQGKLVGESKLPRRHLEILG